MFYLKVFSGRTETRARAHTHTHTHTRTQMDGWGETVQINSSSLSVGRCVWRFLQDCSHPGFFWSWSSGPGATHTHTPRERRAVRCSWRAEDEDDEEQFPDGRTRGGFAPAARDSSRYSSSVPQLSWNHVSVEDDSDVLNPGDSCLVKFFLYNLQDRYDDELWCDPVRWSLVADYSSLTGVSGRVSVSIVEAQSLLDRDNDSIFDR